MRQAMAGRRRQHDTGEVQRVEELVAGLGLRIRQEREIERSAVGDHGAVADEIDQFFEDTFRMLRHRHVGVSNAG